MKETIIKVVTAVLCVVALCVAAFVAVGNYSDALKEAAKLTGTESIQKARTRHRAFFIMVIDKPPYSDTFPLYFYFIIK